MVCDGGAAAYPPSAPKARWEGRAAHLPIHTLWIGRSVISQQRCVFLAAESTDHRALTMRAVRSKLRLSLLCLACPWLSLLFLDVPCCSSLLLASSFLTPTSGGCHLGRHLGGHLGVIWGSSGSHLGVTLVSSGCHLGVTWDHMGVIWVSSGGSPGCHLWVIWGHMGVIWVSSGCHLGVIWGVIWVSSGCHLGGHLKVAIQKRRQRFPRLPSASLNVLVLPS